MEEEVIALLLIMEKRRKGDNVRRQNMACLRNKEDPFHFEETIFRKFFRFPKTLCLDLIQELKPYDEQKSGIPFELRFISVLYFLANGSYQNCIANSYFSAMSQASVSRNINYICKLIVNQKRKEISFPNTIDQYNAVKMSFHSKFGIKGCIGAIDHNLATVGVVPHDYMNRKGYYRINVEAICVDNLIFRHANARFHGSCHDSGIWATSPARIIIRARNTIERAFAVLKSHFRCLSRERTLRYFHSNVAADFAYTCAIFHNILQKKMKYLWTKATCCLRTMHHKLQQQIQRNISPKAKTHCKVA